MDDYEYYKLGCKVQGARSIGRKRFLAAVARYYRDKDGIEARVKSAKSKLYLIVQWSKLLLVIDTIEDGKITAGVASPPKVAWMSSTVGWVDEGHPDDRQFPGEDPDFEDGAPGLREPCRPIDPSLIGTAARVLPAITAASETQLARELLFRAA